MALSPTLAATVAALLLAGNGAAAGRPALRLDADAGSPAYGTVEVVGLDAATLALLRQGLTADEWRAVFPVYTGSRIPAAGERPPVAGSWAVEGEVLRFRPRFPLVPGLDYAARFDLARLKPPGAPDPGDGRGPAGGR